MATKSNQIVYLDHAATTAVDQRVVEAMLPYWTEYYGNASSIYSVGRDARKAMEESRRQVANILGCQPKELIFTSCGTESDNLALRGVALARRAQKKSNHIITSAVEHHAILHTCEQLEKRFGFEVTYLPVDEYGRVSPDDVAAAIRDDTALISVMAANNEVGTIQPIADIGRVARQYRIPFHTDAVQAGGTLDLNVDNLHVDLLSLSAHKFYGPKGIGLLYVRKGTPLLPTQTGGGHEGSRRAGTENVAYIVGLAKALTLAYEHAPSENARLIGLRDRLIDEITSEIPEVQLSGHPTERLPNSASFLIRYIEGESILLNLDLLGICASSGSACTSGSLDPSHVLTAMGVPHDVAHGSLRLTLGRENTDEDVDYVMRVLPGIVEKLRLMSPLYRPANPPHATHSTED